MMTAGSEIQQSKDHLKKTENEFKNAPKDVLKFVANNFTDLFLPKVAKSFASSFLPYAHSLQELDLNSSHLTGEIRNWKGERCKRQDNSGIKTIVSSLKTHSKLKKLNLSNNSINNEGALVVSELLGKNNSTLESLDISRNEIWEEGFEGLTKELREDKCLKTFIAADNAARDSGACCFARMLLVNDKLQALDLSSNYIFDKGGVSLAKCFLNQNRTLRRLLLFGNKTGQLTKYAFDKVLLHCDTLESIQLVADEDGKSNKTCNIKTIKLPLQENIMSKNQQMNILKQKLKVLERKEKTAAARLDELRNDENINYGEEIEKLKVVEENLDKIAHKRTEEIEELKKEVLTLEDNIQEMECCIERMKGETENLTTRRQTIELKSKDLQISTEQHQKIVDRLESRKAMTLEATAKVNAELSVFAAEHARTKARFDEAEQAWIEIRRKNVDLQVNIENLFQETLQCDRAHNDSQSELGKVQQKHQELLEKFEITKQRREKARAKLNRLKQKYADSKHEATDAMALEDLSKQSVSEVKAANVKLIASLQDFTINHDDDVIVLLESRVRDILQEKENVVKERDTYLLKLQELGKKIKTLEQNNEKFNHSNHSHVVQVLPRTATSNSLHGKEEQKTIGKGDLTMRLPIVSATKTENLPKKEEEKPDDIQFSDIAELPSSGLTPKHTVKRFKMPKTILKKSEDLRLKEDKRQSYKSLGRKGSIHLDIDALPSLDKKFTPRENVHEIEAAVVETMPKLEIETNITSGEPNHVETPHVNIERQSFSNNFNSENSLIDDGNEYTDDDSSSGEEYDTVSPRTIDNEAETMVEYTSVSPTNKAREDIEIREHIEMKEGVNKNICKGDTLDINDDNKAPPLEESKNTIFIESEAASLPTKTQDDTDMLEQNEKIGEDHVNAARAEQTEIELTDSMQLHDFDIEPSKTACNTSFEEQTQSIDLDVSFTNMSNTLQKVSRVATQGDTDSHKKEIGRNFNTKNDSTEMPKSPESNNDQHDENFHHEGAMETSNMDYESVELPISPKSPNSQNSDCLSVQGSYKGLLNNGALFTVKRSTQILWKYSRFIWVSEDLKRFYISKSSQKDIKKSKYLPYWTLKLKKSDNNDGDTSQSVRKKQKSRRWTKLKLLMGNPKSFKRESLEERSIQLIVNNIDSLTLIATSVAEAKLWGSALKWWVDQAWASDEDSHQEDQIAMQGEYEFSDDENDVQDDANDIKNEHSMSRTEGFQENKEEKPQVNSKPENESEPSLFSVPSDASDVLLERVKAEIKYAVENANDDDNTTYKTIRLSVCDKLNLKLDGEEWKAWFKTEVNHCVDQLESVSSEGSETSE